MALLFPITKEQGMTQQQQVKTDQQLKTAIRIELGAMTYRGNEIAGQKFRTLCNAYDDAVYLLQYTDTAAQGYKHLRQVQEGAQRFIKPYLHRSKVSGDTLGRNLVDWADRISGAYATLSQQYSLKAQNIGLSNTSRPLLSRLLQTDSTGETYNPASFAVSLKFRNNPPPTPPEPWNN